MSAVRLPCEMIGNHWVRFSGKVSEIVKLACASHGGLVGVAGNKEQVIWAFIDPKEERRSIVRALRVALIISPSIRRLACCRESRPFTKVGINGI